MSTVATGIEPTITYIINEHSLMAWPTINEHSLLVVRNSNIFILFPVFSEEPSNFYSMEDRKPYNALYYYPDNTILSKNELNSEKGQV